MNKDLLEDYLTQAELAESLKLSARSIARYRNEPDGIPYTIIGGRIYHKRSSVEAWLAKREKHPNPRRT